MAIISDTREMKVSEIQYSCDRALLITHWTPPVGDHCVGIIEKGSKGQMLSGNLALVSE